MSRYLPHVAIAPEFTDESLRGATLYARSEADKLLRLPPEYRQTCEAEVHRRTVRTDRYRGEMLLVSTDPCAARTGIVAEILAQLAVTS